MNTQATATKVTRKAAAAAKFSDKPLEGALGAMPEPADLPTAEQRAAMEAAEAAAQAKTGAGLTAAKAATKRASRAKVVKGAAAELVLAPATVEVPAAPAKKSRSKKAAAAELPAFEPVCVKDENNHCAIAVAATEKVVEFIPMDGAGLSVISISRDRFAHDYKAMADYPVAKAARVFLTQPIGMDPKAKAVLEVLAAAEADKPIASGTLVALMSKHDETAAQERAAAAVSTEKAPKAAATPKAPKVVAPKADRKAKPLGRSAVNGEKALAVGEVDYKSKVRPGTYRYALMEAIVTAAKKGAKVADVLGKEVMAGKPGVAAIDITFAVQCKYAKFAE